MNLKDVITIASPILGELMGGPAGSAVGSMVASAFKSTPDNPSDLFKKIQDAADSVAKIKQLELDAVQMVMQSQQNAQKAESSKHDHLMMILGLLVFLCWIGSFIVNHHIHNYFDSDAVDKLGNMSFMVLGYYFGNSLRSVLSLLFKP